MRSQVARFGLTALPVFALGLKAQAPVTVRGVAYDSLRGIPLSHAVVGVLGMSASVTTDERGHFSIAGVPQGSRTFVVQHASLDSIGFRGLSRRHLVAPGIDEVRLAVPSFRTLWAVTCGGTPPADSGFLYGTVRHTATKAPVAGARVEVSWIVTTYDKSRGIRQRRVRGRAATDVDGNYAACGVPTSHWLKVAADRQGASAGVDLPPSELRIVRRDMLIGPEILADSASRGTILGHLTDESGAPYSEARVLLDDSTELRSRGDGNFAFRGIRAGTHQLEITSIGMAPIVAIVDVHPGDSAVVEFSIRKVTTLDVVQVTASTRARKIAEGIEERRRRGLGMQMDMAQLQGYAAFRSVLNDFPGVRVVQKGAGDYQVLVSDGRGGQCTPEVWIDGARQAVASLTMINPRNVTAVEYYARGNMVPIEFRRTELFMTCGAILVWTNWAFSR